MTKYVIDTVELKKRQYVIEAYNEKAALELLEDTEPIKQEVLSDTIYNIHTINEYEYKNMPDYNEGHDLFLDNDFYRRLLPHCWGPLRHRCRR